MDRQKIASSFREVQEFYMLKTRRNTCKSIFESDEWSRSEGGGEEQTPLKMEI